MGCSLRLYIKISYSLKRHSNEFFSSYTVPYFLTLCVSYAEVIIIITEFLITKYKQIQSILLCPCIYSSGFRYLQ